MIKSIAGQEGTSYRWETVARPWSGNAPQNIRTAKKISFCDPEEEVAICLSCPRADCSGSAKCTMRLWGQPKKDY